MKKHYSLEQKIDALNLIQRLDDNVPAASKKLRISKTTLYLWREDEALLRHDYEHRRRQERSQLAADLQMKMLKRAKALLIHMTDKTFKDVPLHQLAYALGSLIRHARKLSDLIEENHDKYANDPDYQHDFRGWRRVAPPRARDRASDQGKIQSRRLWAEMGQDRTRKVNHPRSRRRKTPANLVARPHPNKWQARSGAISSAQSLAIPAQELAKPNSASTYRAAA